MRRIVGTMLSWGTLVMALTVVFVLNATYWPQGDDMMYGALVDPMTGEVGRITSIVQAFRVSFFSDGYRPVVHFLTRLFCYKWLSAFPFFNVAMSAALLALILKYSLGKFIVGLEHVAILVLFYLAVLCTGESTIYISGSCNYLWTSVVALLFLLTIRRIEFSSSDHVDMIWMIPIAFIFGLMQESFALPIGFALFLITLWRWRSLSLKKLIVYGSFVVGFLLLLIGNSKRLSYHNESLFAFNACVGDLIKYFWTIKTVDFAFLIFLFRRDKNDFVKRNLFEILIVVGTLVMVLLLGFYGERMVYLANICGLVIILREIKIPRKILYGVISLDVALACLILRTNCIACENARRSVETYRSSATGVYCMNKIGYPLWRYTMQDFPSWGECSDCHKIAMSAYYVGVTNKVPLGISSELYEDLYLKDVFCVRQNRLMIPMEAYTTPSSDAIVIPLKSGDKTDYSAMKAVVRYSARKGVIGCLTEKWHQWHDIEILRSAPVVLPTPHGRYLLVAKKRMCEDRIVGVSIVNH